MFNTKRIKSKLRLNTKSKTKKKHFQNDKYSKTDLYAQIKPIKEYYLSVSNLHTIYFATYGNPKGKPVLYVHGGPGVGTNPNMARFFNPKKYFIILVDQRGCGKSKPSAELRENKTQNLLSDFEKIRKHLDVKKWMVFGGSWGSTLSLIYAINYPQYTSELIIRGIFLCTEQEVDWIAEPGGAELINPAGWEQYAKLVKHKNVKTKFIEEYKKCFKEKFGKQKKDKCLLAWSVWENSMSTLNKKKLAEVIKETKKSNYKEVSAIELHYFENNCFLTPNYFLNKKNLNILKKIPIVIVQGIYDLVCPFISAYKLHKLLPHSKFYPTMAGHTAMDTNNIKYLVKATDSFVTPFNNSNADLSV